MENRFVEHNREVAKVWESYHAGHPIRMPMQLSFNARMYLLDPKYSRGISFQQYCADPMLMADVQLYGQNLFRQELWQDWEMGVPENGYTVNIDFQNVYEGGFLGAELLFPEGDVPFSKPFLTDDNKELLFEKGLPDPFGNLAATVWEYYDRLKEREEKGWTFNGKPVQVAGLPGFGTDGPMTTACIIRGATEFCIDMYEDPDYAAQLLDYLTDAAIARIKAFRKRMGWSEIADNFGFADDSILLLSEEMYKEWILPRHKRLVRELAVCDENGRSVNPIGIHLCGDATRHFQTIRDELNCYAFDTGFPVDHAWLMQTLGPDVTVSGGVHVDLLRTGTPEQVRNETRRIIEAVKPYTRKFIMKEANNLAPRTPMENIRAMYEAVREFGIYED